MTVGSQPRPLGINLLATLSLLVGVPVLVVGVYGIGTAPSTLGAVEVGLALLSIVLALGLLRGNVWAWITTIIFYVSGMLYSIALAVSGSISYALGIPLSIVIIWYLWRPNVKSYFGRPGETPTAQSSEAKEASPSGMNTQASP